MNKNKLESMVLHGKYKNGKVTITDEKPPEGESDVIVRFVPKGGEGSRFLSLAGMWADRDDMGDSAEWVAKQRKREDNRSSR